MFKLTLVDFDSDGKEREVETVELKNFRPWEREGLTEREYVEREMAVFCGCEKPGDPEYVESAVIPGIGKVNKHGYICRKCGRFVQIG